MKQLLIFGKKAFGLYYISIEYKFLYLIKFMILLIYAYKVHFFLYSINNFLNFHE